MDRRRANACRQMRTIMRRRSVRDWQDGGGRNDEWVARDGGCGGGYDRRRLPPVAGSTSFRCRPDSLDDPPPPPPTPPPTTHLSATAAAGYNTLRTQNPLDSGSGGDSARACTGRLRRFQVNRGDGSRIQVEFAEFTKGHAHARASA